MGLVVWRRIWGAPLLLLKLVRVETLWRGRAPIPPPHLELQGDIAILCVGCEILETCCLLSREAGS